MFVVVAMASSATAVLAGSVYALLLLLPSQSWVLAAADAYAHYVTLPVGLWTLAAMIILAERIAALRVGTPLLVEQPESQRRARRSRDATATTKSA